MPMYEYRCKKCGKQFEMLRRMSDADRELECPKCASEEVERLVSTFSLGSSVGGSCAPAGSRGFS